MRFQFDTTSRFLSVVGRGFVHRDLAARNVLICEGGAAKVADFGRTRDVLVQDGLYTAGAGKVPIRWTSYEALVCINSGMFLLLLLLLFPWRSFSFSFFWGCVIFWWVRFILMLT